MLRQLPESFEVHVADCLAGQDHEAASHEERTSRNGSASTGTAGKYICP